MAGLHKFKLFSAAHCGLEAAAAASGSPALSPTKSPVFHLRRRKTLRMLFDRNSEDRRRNLRQIIEDSPESDQNNMNRARRKLKELLVTSPSPPFEGREMRCSGGEERIAISPATASYSGGEFIRRRTGLVRGLRYRILKKAWRPVLVSIPEQ